LLHSMIRPAIFNRPLQRMRNGGCSQGDQSPYALMSLFLTTVVAARSKSSICPAAFVRRVLPEFSKECDRQPGGKANSPRLSKQSRAEKYLQLSTAAVAGTAAFVAEARQTELRQAALRKFRQAELRHAELRQAQLRHAPATLLFAATRPSDAAAGLGSTRSCT
jgi:hypothetical protein